MKHIQKCAGFLLAMAGAVAFAQEPSSPVVASTTNSTVAYVYVSSSPSSGTNQINAYSAASSGALTAVAGSPFNLGSENVTWMAVNSKNLFGSANPDIYSFSIASDGALQQKSVINASSYNPYQGGGPVSLFLDHTGATLYDNDFYAYGTGTVRIRHSRSTNRPAS